MRVKEPETSPPHYVFPPLLQERGLGVRSIRSRRGQGKGRAARREGVVFKLLRAPYQEGKIESLSAAVAVKVKFWKAGEFIVSKLNDKNSVTLVAYKGQKRVVVGKCTVPTKYQEEVKPGSKRGRRGWLG